MGRNRFRCCSYTRLIVLLELILMVAVSAAYPVPGADAANEQTPLSGETPTEVQSPWATQDIGDVGLAGSASYSIENTFTITGAGSDIWGSEDAFHYVYQALSGDVEVVARIAEIQSTDPEAKAGVMVRESLTPDSPFVSIFLTPDNRIVFQHRESPGSNSQRISASSTVAPQWVKLIRKGKKFKGYKSNDGVNWEQIGAVKNRMAQDVYPGLAVTSHNKEVLNKSVFDNVEIFAKFVDPASSQVLAFPGAEGFGRFARGGRGGGVYQVTNLNNSGPGSLRACVEASGPRTCVFRVSGTIELQRDITTNNPYLTIAGQTAPGDGITLKNFGLFVGDQSIIRYIRIRPGLAFRSQQNINGIWVGGNSIVDHCSISWGTDDLAMAWGEGSHDITYQWNIISEGLAKGLAGETASNLGLLIGSGATNISVHHNLFAHIRQRAPNLESSGDVVNNVVYNYWREPMTLITYNRPGYTNIVGNYFKYGVDTDPTGYEIRLMGGYPTTQDSSAYLSDNVVDKTGRVEPALTHQEQRRPLPIRSSRHNFPQATTTSALEAYMGVLAGAGASRPGRDAVDLRIISEVQDRTGQWASHPSDVGGWPALSSGSAPADSDSDGMPDYWEVQYGLNPNSAADGRQDADGDGYTNLEEFLNETNPLVGTIGQLFRLDDRRTILEALLRSVSPLSGLANRGASKV